MKPDNKRNILYFEAESLRELHACLDGWQVRNQKRFHSLSVHQDNGIFCCIALTNPTEVVITSADGQRHADVRESGSLWVTQS